MKVLSCFDYKAPVTKPRPDLSLFLVYFADKLQ